MVIDVKIIKMLKAITLLFLCLFLAGFEAKILKRRMGIMPTILPATTSNQKTIPFSYFEQKVDHFNCFDNRTYKMRYLWNNEFYKPGGPICVFFGGEWEINSGYVQTGCMYDLAKKLSGTMYYIEHRFYGQSMPCPDYNLTCLKYLSSQQALADYAVFIDTVRNKNYTNAKVLVVGGSYSATLAIWARQKYPHLVDCAVASSSPLVATENFYQYYEVVGDNIQKVSPECYQTIANGIREMDLALQSDATRIDLENKLDTCKTIRTESCYKYFLFNGIAEPFAGAVQYGTPSSILAECKKLLAFNGTDLDKLCAYNRLQYGNFCMGDYDDFCSYYASPLTSHGIYRPWLYQSWTEFGFYQTCEPDQLFGPFPMELTYDMNKRIFGEDFVVSSLRAGVKSTNIRHGGLNPNSTKIVCIQGDVDPWSAIGLMQDTGESKLYYLSGTSHCADLLSISNSDSSALRYVKQSVQDLCIEWLTT